MATFDQLAADQRAIVDLVLRKGRSYAQIGDMLDMSEDRVRELARDALGELAPATARRVDPDWRGQLVDYILGQQAGPEAAATRGHLKRSEPARMWAFSLLDSLDDLYGDGDRPDIPEPGSDRPRRERAPRGTREEKPPRDGGERPAARRSLSPDARSAVKRRRLIAGAVAALAAVAAVLLLTGVIGGGDDGDDDKAGTGTQAAQQQGGQPDILAQAVLTPVGGQRGQGAALITRQQNGQQSVVALLIRAQLAPSKRGEQYYIWLYNSERDVLPLAADATDKQGNLTGAAALPQGYEKYRFVDITRQKTNSRSHGTSVMRGPLTQPTEEGAAGAQPGAGAQGAGDQP